MSSNTSAMFSAYLNQHPETAVRHFELYSIENMSDIIAMLSKNDAVLILKHILPHYVPLLLTSLGHEYFVELLKELSLNQLIDFLRQLEINDRHRIIEQLPQKLQTKCKSLLYYKKTMVGAWMWSGEITFPNQCSVKEALHRLKHVDNIQQSSDIFIVNSENAPIGKVSVFELLRADEQSDLTLISHNFGRTLPESLPLEQVKNFSEWSVQDVLPVVNTTGKMIGVLNYNSVIMALHTMDKNQTQGQPLVNSVLENYNYLVSSIVRELPKRSIGNNKKGK